MTSPPPVPREAKEEANSILRLLLAPANAKTVFDLSWKIIPLLWLAFQFYNNQDVISKKADSNTARIIGLETEFNKLDRDLVEIRAELKAMHDQMDNDRQFYMQTNAAHK